MQELIDQLTSQHNALRQAVEEELITLGLASPIEEKNIRNRRPVYPEQITKLTEIELRDNYDLYLGFYEFLTTQLIRFKSSLLVEQHKAKKVRAAAVIDISKDKTLTNADLKAAAVELYGALTEVENEVLYLTNIVEGFEEAKRSASKIMDRLYRELMLRADAASIAAVQTTYSNSSAPPSRRTFSKIIKR